MEYTFYTFLEPKPSFDASVTEGCGPLTVQFTNTTPNPDLFTYQWNFGNGQTSTQPQPGAMSFLPNPNYGDTTYIVKLSAISPCNTLVFTKNIRVQSKPKALFAPSKTVGCSPMHVVFNNTSLGIGNNYIWDFGDGSLPVHTTSTDTIGHTYYTAVRDTFYARLIAVNQCGTDTLQYAIVVAPNTIKLDFAVNGNQQSGCTPHSVKFINNSRGASSFTWDFGDGNIINTTRNIDTVAHSYLSPGTYVVTLHATNGCSDTTSTETIIAYPKPKAAFSASVYTACIGDAIRFTNLSDSATSYLWQFGDGNTSTLASPSHSYASPGLYTVSLIAYRYNAPGSFCIDSVKQQVQVVVSLPGSFMASDTIGYCAPFKVSFSNQNLPSVTTVWDFGDGTTATGNNVEHIFMEAGTYSVTLTSTAPGGCTYITTRIIKVLGPKGTLSYAGGYLCNNAQARFQVLASNTDTLIFDFGDGTKLSTTNNVVFHSYANAGIYLPSVILKNKAGCEILLRGVDSLRVDKIKADFTSVAQLDCGSTTINFSDASVAFFGKGRCKMGFW